MDAGKYAEEMSGVRSLVAEDFYGATDEEYLILGADTTVDRRNHTGKPEDYDDAVRMLESIRVNGTGYYWNHTGQRKIVKS